jgi:hypothetical protein
MEVTGSLDLDCSGDIELNADNGTITLNDDAVTMAKFTTSGIEANRKFTVTGATHFEHLKHHRLLVNLLELSDTA